MPKSTASIGSACLLLLAGGTVVVWLWVCWCRFPASAWNDIRLAPAFMLRFGPTPYPSLAEGPVTTWIYGPVPLLLNLPATLAPTAALALLIAGAINIALAVGPAALVLAVGPGARATTTPADRAWALLLTLALWPSNSLLYFQADNAALAFGLFANVLLLQPRTAAAKPPVLAAICTALAVWSKQTSLGLVLAQLIWLASTAGPRAAARYALACAASGLALGAAFIAWFGFDALWLNLVRLPARLPFWPDSFERIRGLWPHLTGYLVLPAIVVVVSRSAVWRRDSPWLLPVLAWLCLLPTSMVSILKIGGTANSLNGFLYLLPTGALFVASSLRIRLTAIAPALLGAGVAAIVAGQLFSTPHLQLRPVTAHLRQADYLARQFPGQIYFPWNPLVTFFSERRFYHTEDGLYVRYTAQLAPTRAAAWRNFPPRWCVTAMQDDGWGIILQLQPPIATRARFGAWTLWSWPLPSP